MIYFSTLEYCLDYKTDDIIHLEITNTGKINIYTINNALDVINYEFCTIDFPDLSELETKKPIKARKLKTNTINNKILSYFDIGMLRELEYKFIENNTTLINDLYYCRINKKGNYDFSANNKLVENIKVLREKIKNEDILFDIFKKAYEEPVYIEIRAVSYSYPPDSLFKFYT